MLFARSIISTLTIAVVAALGVSAAPSYKGESHTVKFVNKCGKGTPKLQRNGEILNKDGAKWYTERGGRLVATAWLETDECKNNNGENCTLVLIDLENGTESNNADSSVDIDIHDQYKFSVPVKFQYYGPCNGGNQCLSSSCCPDGAICKDNQNNFSERQCLGNNANVKITFCPDGKY